MSVPARSTDLDPTRLRFLDGVRGLAALYVALHHAALMIAPHGLSGPASALRFLFRHGHSAVAVFIVLSGYCLTLPTARGPEGTPLNLRRFFLRRGRRILPAYFGALAGCLLLIAAVPALGRASRTPWDRALPPTGGGVVFSHLMLVHNVHESWFYKIDPPMWSVATEWQIYFLFPVLLGVQRRCGLLAVIAAGFGVGFGVAALAAPLNNPALRELCPWFCGLFALGMAAAILAHRRVPLRLSWHAPRSAVALAGAAVLLAAVAIATSDDPRFMVADPLVGLIMAGLLVRWTRRAAPESTRPRPPLLRWLEARMALGLGAVSYSLYLVHYPLLAWSDAWLRRWGFGPEARFWTLIVGASPVILLAAAAFHRVFERPFQAAREGSTRVDEASRLFPSAVRPEPASAH